MKRLITLLMLVVIVVSVVLCTAPKALAATTVTVTDAKGVNMRADAGTGYEKVGAVPNGTSLDVQEIKRADNYTWGKVGYNGITGWIAVEYTNYDPNQTPATPETTTGKWKRKAIIGITT